MPPATILHLHAARRVRGVVAGGRACPAARPQLLVQLPRCSRTKAEPDQPVSQFRCRTGQHDRVSQQASSGAAPANIPRRAARRSARRVRRALPAARPRQRVSTRASSSVLAHNRTRHVSSPEGPGDSTTSTSGPARCELPASRVHGTSEFGSAQAVSHISWCSQKPPRCISTSSGRLQASRASRSRLLASTPRNCAARASQATARTRRSRSAASAHRAAGC